MGEKGPGVDGRSGRHCSVTGVTLGLCNLVYILTLWGCVLEKHLASLLIMFSCFPTGSGAGQQKQRAAQHHLPI